MEMEEKKSDFVLQEVNAQLNSEKSRSKRLDNDIIVHINQNGGLRRQIIDLEQQLETDCDRQGYAAKRHYKQVVVK